MMAQPLLPRCGCVPHHTAARTVRLGRHPQRLDERGSRPGDARGKVHGGHARRHGRRQRGVDGQGAATSRHHYDSSFPPPDLPSLWFWAVLARTVRCVPPNNCALRVLIGACNRRYDKFIAFFLSPPFCKVDDSATRILWPFFAMGLFDKPNNNTNSNNVTSAAYVLRALCPSSSDWKGMCCFLGKGLGFYSSICHSTPRTPRGLPLSVPVSLACYIAYTLRSHRWRCRNAVARHNKLAADISAQSIVLLKNDKGSATSTSGLTISRGFLQLYATCDMS